MEALGIDGKLIIAQMVNFIILLLLLRKFLYQPVLKMMEERQEKIKAGLAQAEEAEKKLGAAENEVDKIRDQAYQERDTILKDAKDEASREAVEIVKKANDQADRILQNSKEEAEFNKEKALKEAKKEVSELVIASLDKIVGEELDQKDKAKLTSKAIDELEIK